MAAEPRTAMWLDPDGKTLRFGRRGQAGTDDGVNIGECYREVDGYLVWVPRENGGCWEAPHLRMVADFLDEANREWHESVMAYFDKSQGEDGGSRQLG